MCKHHGHEADDESHDKQVEVESTGSEEDSAASLSRSLSRRGMLAATGGTLGVLGVSGSASAHSPWQKNPYAHEYDPADGSNYSNSSRRAGNINWVVVHVTAGTFGSAVNWFKDPTADVSAHYVIRDEDGYCKQMVLDEDVAWHAAGINSPSIGIEHEWYDGQGGLSDDNLWRSANIVRHIADEYNIPLTYYTDPCEAANAGGGLVGHTDAPKNGTCSNSSKSCPYPPWDWKRYMRHVFNAGGKNIPEGWYKIENLNSGKALDVRDRSTDNGATIQQWNYGGGDNQQWYADYLGGGKYRLIADHSNKVADVEGYSTDDGGDIHQWEWTGNDNQKWWIVPSGAYYRIVSVHSMKVMGVSYGSTENGANVIQWEWNGNPDQRWALTPI